LCSIGAAAANRELVRRAKFDVARADASGLLDESGDERLDEIRTSRSTDRRRRETAST
jgi:hypothetical protein